MTATPAIPSRRARRLLAVTAAGVLLMAAACGDDDDATSSSGDSGNSSSGPTLEITGPSDGADVEEGGFEVTFASSEELGTTDTGKDHVHLYYDGSDSDYDVVESDSFTVDKLTEGEHTLKAVLAHADHSLTDASDEITVKVEEGGGSGGGSDTTDDDSGY